VGITIILPASGSDALPVAAYGQIHRSEDGGLTWDTVYTASTDDGSDFYSNSCVDKSSTGIICASGNYKVRRSTDGGLTWAQVFDLWDDAYDDLKTIACGGNTWCVGGNGGRVYRSAGGAPGSWSHIYTYPYAGEVQSFVTNAAGVWLAVLTAAYDPVSGTWANDLIYKSLDDGLSWTSLGRLPDGATYPSRSVSASSTDKSGTWLLGTQNSTGHNTGSIYKSTDNGESWTRTVTFPAGTFTSARVEHIQTDGNGTWCCTYSNSSGDGIYRSTDGGDTWSCVFYRATASPYGPFTIATNNNGVWFAASVGYYDQPRLYRSTNDGVTWEDYTGTPFGAYMSIGDFIIWGDLCPTADVQIGPGVVFE